MLSCRCNVYFSFSLADVTSVTMYGKLRHTWEVQQEQQVLNDQGFFDDVTLSDDTVTSHKSLQQMTSISKLNVIPSAGMKQLWVEGNRIKVKISTHTYSYIHAALECPDALTNTDGSVN